MPLSDSSSGGHLSLPRCPSPMTLRCLEPSGNGAEGTRSQWGTAGSAEEPSPEAARLAKALRELSQTGRERNGRDACERGYLPTDAAGGCADGPQLGSGAEVGSKEEDGITTSPLLLVPASGRGTAERMPHSPGFLGMRKESGSQETPRSGGGQSGRRAPWKLPLRALEPWLFPPCSRVGTRARTLAGQSAWRLPFRAVRVDAALPAAAASSGSRGERLLHSGIWAAKSRDRQIAAQAAAAEPGGARPSGAAHPEYCWFRVQSCALCGLLSSLGI